MLDRIFRRAAAGANAGLLLEKLGIARGPEHFIDGRGHMVIGEIKRVGPARRARRSSPSGSWVR